jgi:hypothetical protein
MAHDAEIERLLQLRERGLLAASRHSLVCQALAEKQRERVHRLKHSPGEQDAQALALIETWRKTLARLRTQRHPRTRFHGGIE